MTKLPYYKNKNTKNSSALECETKNCETKTNFFGGVPSFEFSFLDFFFFFFAWKAVSCRLCFADIKKQRC